MFKKIIILIIIFFTISSVVFAQEEYQPNTDSDGQLNYIESSTSINNNDLEQEADEEIYYEPFKEPLESFYAVAVITNIIESQKKTEINNFTVYETQQEIEIEISKGSMKGQHFSFINEVNNNPLDLEIHEGDEIIVNFETFAGGDYKIYLVDHYRLNSIILLILLFAFVILLIGGKQGKNIIFSLIISILLIFKILIPFIYKGYNPILMALIISIFIMTITYLLVCGFNKKSLIASVGTLGGLIIAIWISYLFTKLSYLTGLSTEEARTFAFKHPEINSQGIFFAGIIIGALGAVMDVAMSISSSLTELKITHHLISFTQLFKSGIQIGKDIMGTMTNTLIFAYAGVSLPLLLLYQDYGGTYQNFINLNYVADEVIRSLCGSIGLITVIPITALFGAFLYSHTKK